MGIAWLVAGLVPLVGGAWLAARHAFRVEPGPARVLAAAVLAWAWLTAGVELLGTLGHLGPAALVGWSLAGLALGGGLAAARPVARLEPGAGPAPAPEPLGFAAGLATALVVWAGFRRGLVSFLQPVKVVSDGPIYHLYMAARWWQEGRVFPVATPFGEVGATYFWANGELWYAWLMTLAGGDRWARIGQVPFLWLAGLAVERIARHLGAGPAAARLGSLWFVAIGPQFVFAFEPNVDALFVAGYALATYFLLRGLTTPGRVDLGSLVLGGLSAGLGMGTKPIGIVFFPPLLLLAVLLLLARRDGRGAGGRLLAVFAVLAPAAAMLGYWPIRNALLTGNPLYPLHVAIGGRVWLAGWFGPGAMALSPYYVDPRDWRAGVDILVAVLDPRLLPVWAVAALGGWAWGRRRPDPAPVGRPAPAAGGWTWGLAALGWFDLAAYWLVIPYRTQQRFMFPALALLAVPLARLLDRAGWLRVLAVGLMALHLATPQTWPVATNEREPIPWDLDRAVPNFVPPVLELPLGLAALGAGGRDFRVLATLATGLGVLGAAGLLALARRASGRGGRRATRLAAGAWLGGWLVAAAFALGAHRAMPFPSFALSYEGWHRLESLAGRDGARVAYAGTKIPYYLMGSRLQNRVRYVPVDAHPDWLLHDYHRNAASVGEPTTWPNPFPTWDRLRPDYDAWLANLRDAGIELLVVVRVVPEEGAENVADAELFPIERVWADAHPEAFRPLYGQGGRDPYLKIYEVRPPVGEIRARSTDRAARSH